MRDHVVLTTHGLNFEPRDLNFHHVVFNELYILLLCFNFLFILDGFGSLFQLKQDSPHSGGVLVVAAILHVEIAQLVDPGNEV